MHKVAYASRNDGTACWSASLTLAQYRTIVFPSDTIESPFFAAAPMPQVAKFGPGLIVHKPYHERAINDAKDTHGSFVNSASAEDTKDLSVTALAFVDTMGKSSGIRVVLNKGVESIKEVRGRYPPTYLC